MNLTALRPWLLVAGLICIRATTTPLGAQVLFDNTKAETAGNADWIIDTHQPIPASFAGVSGISGITASTPEAYWNGALSSWGIALAKLANAGQISLSGNGLETLPSGGRITYGDASNVQDLSHYQVYVVCEPNILFTAAEKTALLNFVRYGGGLFLVADHTGSDRNNDGHDSLEIWNDLLTNNVVQNNPLGFVFNTDSVTPAATVDGSIDNPMTHGIGGIVTTLKYDVGCTMNLTDNTVAHAAVWQTNPSKVMALYGTFGAGRFCAIGDSSVMEDSTSSQGTTYNGWTTPADNGYCVINGMAWLLGAGSSNHPPAVNTMPASSVGPTNATLNGSVNPNGLSTTAKFAYGLTTNYSTIVVLTGTYTGSNSIAVNTNLSGLAPATTYHFRLDATNATGLTLGLDQSFTTTTNASTNLPPNAITSAATSVGTNSATLNGSLNPNNQSTTGYFEYGLTTSYGTIVPMPGTFTGSSNISVSTNLSGLASGTAYHFRLDATNASGLTLGVDQSFTTVSTNGTGVSSNSYFGVLAGWEVTGLSGYGPSPFVATTNAPNVSVVGLTRGTGAGTAPTAAANAWGGTGFVFANEATAIAGSSYVTFSVTAGAGYTASFTNIPAYNIRHSGTGSTSGIWQCQVGGGTFIDIGSAIVWGATTTAAGNPENAIDLSGIPALQNVAGGIPVTFRIVLWGGTGTGTWYVNNLAGEDLVVSGMVAPSTVANTAPVFTTPPANTNIVVNAGTRLSISCLATDADPAQTLTYSLLLGPTNATVSATTGNFLWRPRIAQTDSTNAVQVVVTDDGTPNLRATNNFTITVTPFSTASLTAPALTGGQFHCSINGTPGPDYAVQVSSNLASGTWTTLLSTNSPDLPFLFTDPNPLQAQRFYRVVASP